jgi:hypothetical protein
MNALLFLILWEALFTDLREYSGVLPDEGVEDAVEVGVKVVFRHSVTPCSSPLTLIEAQYLFYLEVILLSGHCSY